MRCHPISLLKPPSPRAVPAAQLECGAGAADAARRDKQHARADGGGAARPGLPCDDSGFEIFDDGKDADYESDGAAVLMSVETAEKQTLAVVPTKTPCCRLVAWRRAHCGGWTGMREGGSPGPLTLSGACDPRWGSS